MAADTHHLPALTDEAPVDDIPFDTEKIAAKHLK
jgi:hypothetical protein